MPFFCLAVVTHIVLKTNLALIAGLRIQVWITTTQDQQDPFTVVSATAVTRYPFSVAPQEERSSQA